MDKPQPREMAKAHGRMQTLRIDLGLEIGYDSECGDRAMPPVRDLEARIESFVNRRSGVSISEYRFLKRWLTASNRMIRPNEDLSSQAPTPSHWPDHRSPGWWHGGE